MVHGGRSQEKPRPQLPGHQMSGFPSPPHEGFQISLSRFPTPFPTLLPLANFTVLWGSISALGGNARAQTGSQESGMGRGEKRQGERRPS